MNLCLRLTFTAAALGIGLAAYACQISDTDSDDDDAGVGTTSTASGGTGGSGGSLVTPEKVRIAQFNLREMTTYKLMTQTDVQANAAAEIIARFSPDILSINELQFDIQGIPSASSPGAPSNTSWGGFNVPGAENPKRLGDRVHAAGGPSYENLFQSVGNSGFYWQGSTLGLDWYILRGWGEFPGRFNTAILSRFPILVDQVRVIADFAWEDLPDNKIALMKTETGIDVPPGFPLFEKALNIVPVQLGDVVLHLVLLHPVAPAFDPINTYRNYDELHALRLFLDGQLPGVEPLPADAKFVIIGDLNADPEEGDSIGGAIQQILSHPDVTNVFPAGSGTKGKGGKYNSYLSGCGRDDGSTVTDPGAKYQMQLDYVLPSKNLGEPLDSLLFWPNHTTDPEDFELRCQASDHSFLYVDLKP